MANEKSPTKMNVGPARFSYLTILEPKAMKEGQDKKYSVSLVIPKSNKALIKKIEEAVAAAVAEGIKSKWGGKKPKKLDLPLHDGDDERDTDPVYKDSFYLSAKSTNQPQIVDKDRNEIINKDEIYSGMFGVASVTFFPFSSAGNDGVGVGLNNLMKLKDGPKLTSQSSAEEDFKDIDFNEMEIGEEDTDEDYSDI